MTITFQRLYEETGGLQDLRDHLQAFIERYAVSRALSRESVEGVADAKDIIDAAFADLDEKFGPKDGRDEKAPRSPR